MAQHTFNLNAAQEEGWADQLAQINQKRIDDGQPAFATLSEMIEDQMQVQGTAFNQLLRRKEKAADIMLANSLTERQLANILAALGYVVQKRG